MLWFNARTGLWAGLITGVFSDAAFTLQDDIDPTKQARLQIAGFTAGATRVFTLPDATTSLAGLAVAQTFSAKQTLSNANNDLGTSTGTGTTNLATGATASGNTKTVNVGTAGVSGSTTNVTIGSAVAGALGALTINSPTVTFGSSVSAIAMAAATVSALYLGLGGATADATNRLSNNAPASLTTRASGAIKATLADLSPFPVCRNQWSMLLVNLGAQIFDAGVDHQGDHGCIRPKAFGQPQRRDHIRAR